MGKHPIRSLGIALSTLLAIAGSPAAAAPAEFIAGYAGSLPNDAQDRARTYFDQPAVRALIARLDRAPLTVAAAEAALAGSPARLADLERLKLVTRQGYRVRLGFAYFTAEDMRRIHAVAAAVAPSLVAAYRAHAAAFDRIWALYPVPGVERRDLAFDLIAGVGLNWDGLDLLHDQGWRRPRLVEGPGWRYSFFAEADVPGYDYRGYYWGSSAFPADLKIAPPMPLAFVSFGDPESEPRMNFPDLMGLGAADMTPPVRAAAERLGLQTDPMLGPGVLGVERGRQIGRLLLALRMRPMTQVEAAAAFPRDDAADELELLRLTGYARLAPDGRFELTTPVLDLADRPMLEASRELNREILKRWMGGHYGEIRARLSGLSALRQGVPYEALFTQIWHEIFGLTSRELVASGMVADPRAAGRSSPGSLGMAYSPPVLVRVWR